MVSRHLVDIIQIVGLALAMIGGVLLAEGLFRGKEYAVIRYLVAFLIIAIGVVIYQFGIFGVHLLPTVHGSWDLLGKGTPLDLDTTLNFGFFFGLEYPLFGGLFEDILSSAIAADSFDSLDTSSLMPWRAPSAEDSLSVTHKRKRKRARIVLLAPLALYVVWVVTDVVHFVHVEHQPFGAVMLHAVVVVFSFVLGVSVVIGGFNTAKEGALSSRQIQLLGLCLTLLGGSTQFISPVLDLMNIKVV